MAMDLNNTVASILATLDNRATVLEAPKTISISAPITVVEGDTGSKMSVFTVSRPSGIGAISVPWTFAAGSTDATDYVGGLPAGGTLAFADGVLAMNISIVTAGDTAFETDETATITITPPAGYTSGERLTTTLTIQNDDSPPAPATLAFTESEKQFYARDTMTGGVPNKGSTTITMPTITLSKASSVWARRRHPTTNVIQQAAWKVVDGAVTGTNFAVTGVEASDLESVIDLSPTGTGNWTAGAQVFAVGDVGDIWGQSLAVNQISMVQDGTGHTEAIHPAARVYAAEENNSAAWGRPVQAAQTRFNSAGLARLTNRMIAALGVGFCVVGAPLGGTPARSSTSMGSLGPKRRQCLKMLKTTRYAACFVGHTNSAYGDPAKLFRGGLANAFDLTAANSSIGAAGLSIVLSTIPNIAAGQWGTTATQNVIRRGGYEYITTDAKGFGRKAIVHQTDLALSDGVHQNQAGSIQVADAWADAWLNGTSIVNGLDALPASPVGATPANAPTFTTAGKFLPAAMNGGMAITREIDSTQGNEAAMPQGGTFAWRLWVKWSDLSGTLNCIGELAGGAARIFLTSGKWRVENVNLPGANTAAGPIVNQWHWFGFDVEVPPLATDTEAVGKVSMWMDGVKLSEGDQTGSAYDNLVNNIGKGCGIRAISSGFNGGFMANNAVLSELVISSKPLGSFVPTGPIDRTLPGLYKLHTMNGTCDAVGPL